ncbi:hypothetical protein FH972_002022 [Carpinus fangiana]|uniref:Uncharacterized protein n=1 Tax=Carpinus fangiana TaxID=176857 RepID=A0A5N6QFY9_9ROSI|nr:hypothetical protein FH972_002022 [Carpinus fangiana]
MTQIFEQVNRCKYHNRHRHRNEGIASVSGKPLDMVKKILCVYVVLNYYDSQKLTNLFQFSGFLNVSGIESIGNPRNGTKKSAFNYPTKPLIWRRLFRACWNIERQVWDRCHHQNQAAQQPSNNQVPMEEVKVGKWVGSRGGF